jgi:hypothetical protein
MRLVGDASACILYCQLLHWTRRGEDMEHRDGWVLKTAQEWYHETGLSWKAQRRAREILFRLDLLEERKLYMPARLEYRINLPVLLRQLCQLLSMPPVKLSFADLLQVNDTAHCLFGRGFIYYTAFARRWPVHTAMMCSRLLASVRVPPTNIPGASGVIPGRFGVPQQTRPVRLHRDEWLAEAGLTRDQWQTARRKLKAAGVLLESGRNFPRRVDFALDVAALAASLAAVPASASASTATSAPSSATTPERAASNTSAQASGQRVAPAARCTPACLDRAKQGASPENSPKPASESSGPADSDRPKQPISIAVSNLYLFELLKLKQQQPLVRGREARDGMAWPTFGFGGRGDGYSPEDPGSTAPQGPSEQAERRGQATGPSAASSREHAEADSAAKLASVSQGAAAGESAKPAQPADGAPTLPLVWSKAFTGGDQLSAARHLAGLDHTTQQAILDEIDWMQQGGPVRSPVGLVRALRKQVDAGAFVPDGAHRVQAARQAARARAEALAQARADSTRRATDRTGHEGRMPTDAPLVPSFVIKPEIAEKLKQVRAGIAARRAA